MIKYGANFAKSKLLILKSEVVSKLYWSLLIFEKICALSLGKLQDKAEFSINTGVVDKAEVWHSWGTRIKSGHGKVLNEEFRLILKHNKSPSDLPNCNCLYRIKYIQKAYGIDIYVDKRWGKIVGRSCFYNFRFPEDFQQNR